MSARPIARPIACLTAWVAGFAAPLLAFALLSGCGGADDATSSLDATSDQQAAAPETRLSGPSVAGHYHLNLTLSPVSPVVATYFNLRTEVFAADMSTPATVTNVVVDGWMPMHKHGMEGVSPKTTLPVGKTGVIETEGLFFNMPGQWQLRVDIKGGALGPDTAVFPFFVGP